MNPTTKNNVLTWAVVVLIAANLVVITLFWMGHHKLQQHQHATPAAFLTHELSLDDKQKLQLHDLASQHHAASEKIKENIKDARDRFFDLIKQPNVIPASKDSAAAIIAENLKQLEVLTFDHFQSVRKICTPEQQLKFDKIIDEVLKMVGSPPPGGPPGGGPHNGMPGDHPPGDEPPGDHPPVK